MPSDKYFTALDAVREAGIIIASDGAEYNKIATFAPTDATTNPSLVYAAVCMPEYAHMLDEAVKYSETKLPNASIDEKAQLAMDRLLVQFGLQLHSLIPGRVSISIDPRLGNSQSSILSKSQAILKLVDELDIPRSRILLKIPATQAGIRAAHILEVQQGLRTNLTLVFGLVQALACAQAGVSVISPFVGRVKDWWDAQEQRNISTGVPGQTMTASKVSLLSKHPGLKLVYRIRAAFTAYGYSTQIMAAGFRAPEEIVELAHAGRAGGADLVTLPPSLLALLRDNEGVHGLSKTWTSPSDILDLPNVPVEYFVAEDSEKCVDMNVRKAQADDAFMGDLEQEAIALEKVPEGLDKFSADTDKLEDKIRQALLALGNLDVRGMPIPRTRD